MGANTNIEWTDDTVNFWRLFHANTRRPSMNGIVTRLAKRDAIRHIKPQFGMICKVFDVVRVQVAALFVATTLAGIAVTSKNCRAPICVFGTVPDGAVERFDATFPCVVFVAAHSMNPARGFDSSACLRRTRAGCFSRLPLFLFAQKLFGFFAMAPPLEGRGLSCP